MQEQILSFLIDPFFLLLKMTLMLCSYVIIILIVNMLLPEFEKGTRILFFLIVLATIGPVVVNSFTLIDEIAQGLAHLFTAFYPILTSSFLLSSSITAIASWQPFLLFFVQVLTIISSKWLIPGVLLAIVFDVCSVIVKEISFTRIAELIRFTIMSIVSASVICYVLLMTASGVAAFSVNAAVAEPVKKLIEENIPVVGSFIVDSFSIFQHMTQFTSSLTSISAFIAVITVSFIPTMQLVVSAYSLKMLAAILEPIAFDDICRLLDQISKSLFTLCAVSFLIAFSFMFSCFFLIVFVQVMAGGR